MAKLSKMFPKRYATAEDITQPVVVTIKAVTQEVVYSPWDKAKVKKWALCFQETPRKIILGRKLAYEIAEALDSDETDDWIGQRIVLYSEPIAVAGKQRRTIRARKPEATNGAGKILDDEDPAPANGKPAEPARWTRNASIVARMFEEAQKQFDLNRADVLTALAVDDPRDFDGTKADAWKMIETYAQRQNVS